MEEKFVSLEPMCLKIGLEELNLYLKKNIYVLLLIVSEFECWIDLIKAVVHN